MQSPAKRRCQNHKGKKTSLLQTAPGPWGDDELPPVRGVPYEPSAMLALSGERREAPAATESSTSTCATTPQNLFGGLEAFSHADDRSTSAPRPRATYSYKSQSTITLTSGGGYLGHLYQDLCTWTARGAYRACPICRPSLILLYA
jgi:hypothetical protein